jgi:hypothetical protein
MRRLIGRAPGSMSGTGCWWYACVRVVDGKGRLNQQVRSLGATARYAVIAAVIVGDGPATLVSPPTSRSA